jgi:hypothetical protein
LFLEQEEKSEIGSLDPQRLGELGHVERVSHETVRQTLKKMNLSLGEKTAG